MELFEMTGTPGKIIGAIIFLVASIRLYLNWKRAKETPEVKYEVTTDKPENQWHWSEPPAELGLTVQNSQTESVINFDIAPRMSEYICSLFALLLAVLGAYTTGVAIYRHFFDLPGYFVGSLILAGIILLSAWALTKVDTPILSITRTPYQVRIDIRQALYKRRSIYLRAPVKSGTAFVNKMQSFLEMDIDQIEEYPDFYLLLKKPWHFDIEMILRLPPQQASWVINGLNQWISLQTDKKALG